MEASSAVLNDTGIPVCGYHIHPNNAKESPISQRPCIGHVCWES